MAPTPKGGLGWGRRTESCLPRPGPPKGLSAFSWGPGNGEPQPVAACRGGRGPFSSPAGVSRQLSALIPKHPADLSDQGGSGCQRP